MKWPWNFFECLMAFFRVSIFIGLLLSPFYVYPGESGRYYLVHYPPKIYRAHSQNWAIVQDKKGHMYFGNGEGILIFNGQQWHTIPLPNLNLVRSLIVDDHGKVFAGGYNELGYLEKDKSGRMQYASLVNLLPDEHREFGNVWKIHIIGKSVAFQTEQRIFFWEEDSFHIVSWDYEGRHPVSFLVSENIYVHQYDAGLLKFDKGTIVPVVDGSFYRGKTVTSILPYGNNNLLVGTVRDGLFLYDGRRSIPFRTSIDDFLIANLIYCGLQLDSVTYAFGTLLKGLAIIDKQGNLLESFSKATGLGDDAIYQMKLDAQGGLWLAHSYGIGRVELKTPITVYDGRLGLEGAVNDIKRFEGNLYVATMLGLYQLEQGNLPDSPARFKKIEEIRSSVWGMIEVDQSLLFTTDYGTYELKNYNFSRIDNYSGAALIHYRFDVSRIFVSLADGVAILKKQSGKWIPEGRINGLVADVAEIKEDNHGNIWLGTFSEGVFRLTFPSKNGQVDYLNPIIAHYGSENMLPVGYVKLNVLNEHVIFRINNSNEIHRFDSDKSVFYQDHSFARSFGFDDSDVIMATDEVNGSFWIKAKKQGTDKIKRYKANRSNVGLELLPIEAARILEDVDVVYYEDSDGIVWYGGLEGLVRHEYKKTITPNNSFPTNINRVTVGMDSVIYHGSESMMSIDLPYRLNTLYFEYAASFFDAPEETEYQYILEGFDDAWSSWTKDTGKEYTKIREGKYTFKTRSRNIYGQLSETAEFHFSIFPPLHRHGLAYLIYIMAIMGAVFGYVRLRSAKLLKEKLALEQLVKERTAEIVVKNDQLEQQAEELESQAEKLKDLDRLKSNFFANISHEFRTPLSLILSPLEKMLNQNDSAEGKEIKMMYRNAKRLHNLINQLLDLSKLESGQMKLFLQAGDVNGLIKIVLSSFASLAEDKNISFQIDLPRNPIICHFDSDKLEIILNNLLSNAFKFTPNGGTIKFVLELRKDNEKDYLTMSLADTGPGISEKDLDKIFDRFYQIDGSSLREYEGSGIGLALTHELIRLMHGQISVQSKIGVGTEFIVEMPLTTHPEAEGVLLLDIQTGEYEKSIDQTDNAPTIMQERSINKAIASSESESLVLLVEDNQDMRDYLSEILDKEFRVLKATNGEEGLSEAVAKLPDLILSDMMMPKMDGFSLCEKIRADERTCHIPFILLTARATIESRLEGLELGADEYLTKPFHVKELLVRINNLLEQRKNLRKRFSREIIIQPKEVTVTSTDERFLQKALSILEEHIGDSDFSVEKFSDEIGMSRKNLHRKLIALTDQAPGDLIRNFRLKRAANLLDAKSGNVSEIAFLVGFNNLSYFSKCFKELFGLLPNEYLHRKTAIK